MRMTSSEHVSSQRSGPAAEHLVAAFTDKLAGLAAYSECIVTADFGSDAHRLIIADEDRKLKVWHGHTRESEHVLLDFPVALAVCRPAEQKLPRLAVAAGPCVYIYDNMKPFFKVAMPVPFVQSADQAIWDGVAIADAESREVVSVRTALQQLSDAGTPLCTRSQALLATPKDALTQDHLLAALKQPMQDPPAATCLACLPLVHHDVRSPSCLVIGTEAGQLVLLDSTTMKPSAQWELEDTPALLATHGALSTSYTVFAVLRGPGVNIVRDGALLDRRLSLGSPAVAVAVTGAMLAVALMSPTVTLFAIDSLAPSASIALASPPLALAVLPRGLDSAELLCVALRDCSVSAYEGTACVHRHTLPARVRGMHGGRLMTEDSALVSVLEGGALDVRFLSRKSRLQGAAAAPQDEPPALDVPKKTKLYIEFAKRERENAQALHHAFQRDLLKLRLRTAEAYVKVLTDGCGSAASATGAKLSMTATLLGLGPHFRIQLQVCNSEKRPLLNVPVIFSTNPDLYAIKRESFILPVLVPGLRYMLETDVQCLLPEQGTAGVVHVLVMRPPSSVPWMSAVVNMPVSEIDETV